MQDNSYIGSLFGNYRILAEIACGAFGCVYYASHLYLPRFAAVKLLHARRLDSVRERNRFMQEARFLELLKHPHILPIYEFGISDQLPYLAAEYAPGGSLYELLNNQPQHRLPIAEAVSILSQVGLGLHYAHSYKIIHNDLKPHNILFNARNEAMLSDFGIALEQKTATLTMKSSITGTPTYMAPEQFRGRVSRRSDQYALGCIAYELMTGRPPFRAPNVMALSYKHMHELPIPPSRLNPQIPDYIEDAILKALEKRRINRYPSVLSFICALHHPF